uniref:Ig-like domain-containing protein n=1 Tax=Ornithorhynchus anatinus TaxID=9258 RepID=A0A6I8NW56_ORNAN
MMRVSAALVLLWLPDCVSWEVTGPQSVRVPLGGSLTVRCQYKQEWKSNVKWWCRGEQWSSCQFMAKSSGFETSGRTSIQDRRGNLTFIVTIVNLEAGDTDTYWCGIEKALRDHGHRVKVTVSPPTTRMTVTTKGTPKLTSSAQESSNTDSGSSEWEIVKDLRLLLPLIFAILLILLVGISLVAWRMVLSQKKGESLMVGSYFLALSSS